MLEKRNRNSWARKQTNWPISATEREIAEEYRYLVSI